VIEINKEIFVLISCALWEFLFLATGRNILNNGIEGSWFFQFHYFFIWVLT
jgi:hypothetical protein